MSDSEEIPPQYAGKVCGLCNTNPSRYCCPRCQTLYCSVDCYKSEIHLDCSERFYRECINNELTSVLPDEKSQREMIEILKRLLDYQEGDELKSFPENVVCESDDEEEEDLHERVRGLNLEDSDAVWNALTTDEKNEFEALVSKGDVASIVPAWEPWWMYRRKNKLVKKVEISDEEIKALEKCPPLKKVPLFTLMSRACPSPALKNNITNVLASYVFIARYFIGDIDCIEGAACLLEICDSLNSNAKFDDPDTAMEAVAQKCLQSIFVHTDKESLDIMKHDTILVLQGPSEDDNTYYTKAALSHVHKLLKVAKTRSTDKYKYQQQQKASFSKKFPDHKGCHLPKPDIPKLKNCIKKVEFYLAYVGEYGLIDLTAM